MRPIEVQLIDQISKISTTCVALAFFVGVSVSLFSVKLRGELPPLELKYLIVLTGLFLFFIGFYIWTQVCIYRLKRILDNDI